MKRWLGFAAAICLWASCAAQAQALQIQIPTCAMLFPSLEHASLDTLMGMLHTSGVEQSNCVVDQMPRFGEKAVTPLVALLRSGSPQQREYAAFGLDRLRDHALSATPALEVALDDPSIQVRQAVLDSLESIQPRSPTLTLKLLRQLDRELSASAVLNHQQLIRAIAHMGSLPPEALPILARAATQVCDCDPIAKEELIEAIGRIDTLQRVILLAQLIGDKDPVRAKLAMLVIGRSGSVALPVLLFYRLAGLTGPHPEYYDYAYNWAWRVATTPSLSTYYQTDMTVLLRQLHGSPASARAQALHRLRRLAPAFSLRLPEDGWPYLIDGLHQTGCMVADTLDGDAGLPADKSETSSVAVAAVGVSIPKCPMPIL